MFQFGIGFLHVHVLVSLAFFLICKIIRPLPEGGGLFSFVPVLLVLLVLVLQHIFQYHFIGETVLRVVNLVELI